MAKKPWNRDNPRSSDERRHKRLTSAEKKKAKARARRAGRPYPNLVDNMAVASQKPEPTRSRAGKKSGKTSGKAKRTSSIGRKRKKTG